MQPTASPRRHMANDHGTHEEGKSLEVKFHVYEMNTPIGKSINYQIILNKVQMKKL